MKLAAIAAALDLPLAGDGDCEIGAIATLDGAGEGDISFLANPKYADRLADCRASALILHPQQQSAWQGNCVLAEKPYQAYARLSQILDPRTRPAAGIHPTAIVPESATVDPQASIAANVVLGERVVIGPGSVVAAGSSIGDDSSLGSNCLVHTGVSIYHGVCIGDEVIIHSGAVLGADGFGFAPTAEGWIKIHQLGGVRIGNRVELGACTTIDRGALDDTVIGDDVILDNHVHIAHNVTVGRGTAMAAYSAVAGSSHIGERCTFAGRVSIVGHLDIADGTHITACTMVTRSIKTPGQSYSSGTPVEESAQWRKNAVRYSQLDRIARRLQALERKLKDDGIP